MRIQVMYFEGCPNYQAAIELVRSLAPHAVIEPLVIETQEDAVRRRFLGSPTILVAGLDVEPAARERTDFGFTCRTYNGSGVPSREVLAAAIGCSSPISAEAMTKNWAAGSSVALAILVSACCWLPLVLVGLGVSTLGVSSAVEVVRPWLVAGSVALLGAGFYSAYRTRPCCTRRARLLSRVTVWMASGLVLAFALFPFYAKAFVGPIDGVACCATPGSTCCTPDSDNIAVQTTSAQEAKPSVTVLSNDVHELKDAFNADRNAPKVMLIVSPLCPACRAGASVVEKEALRRIDSDGLKVYVVWIKRFPGDSLKAAEEATQLLLDKRALHFWDGSGALGKQYGKVVRLPNAKKFAWDVYFVFNAGTEWKADPPKPSYWMHQLGGPETGNLLEGDKFREAIVERLPKGQQP